MPGRIVADFDGKVDYVARTKEVRWSFVVGVSIQTRYCTRLMKVFDGIQVYRFKVSPAQFVDEVAFSGLPKQGSI